MENNRTPITDATKNELANYKKIISLGYNQEVEPKLISWHTSKSVALPIVSAKNEGSNVEIDWFGQNFSSHYLGMKFRYPVCSTLLYPISAEFDLPPNSGHINTDIARPLPDFIKASYNQRLINTLGLTTNSISASIIIRYLNEISKLNAEKILKICFEPKHFGKQLTINGDYVEFDELLKAVELEFCEDKETLVLPEDNIFESMKIWIEDSELGGSSVRITMKNNQYLPAMPFPPRGIYANPLDTKLGDYLPPEVQNRDLCNKMEKHIMQSIPVEVMCYERIRDPFFLKHMPNSIYGCLKPGFKELTFNTPTLLDAVMTAVFLIKVVSPISKEYFKD